MDESHKAARAAKIVVVVRGDLKMPKGKLANQVAHAARRALLAAFVTEEVTEDGITSKSLTVTYNEASPLGCWLGKSETTVVLRAADEAALQQLQRQATDAKLPCALITDEGRTVFNGPTVTCLGIGPSFVDDVNAITGHLKLY